MRLVQFPFHCKGTIHIDYRTLYCDVPALDYQCTTAATAPRGTVVEGGGKQMKQRRRTLPDSPVAAGGSCCTAAAAAAAPWWGK